MGAVAGLRGAIDQCRRPEPTDNHPPTDTSSLTARLRCALLPLLLALTPPPLHHHNRRTYTGVQRNGNQEQSCRRVRTDGLEGLGLTVEIARRISSVAAAKRQHPAAAAAAVAGSGYVDYRKTRRGAAHHPAARLGGALLLGLGRWDCPPVSCTTGIGSARRIIYIYRTRRALTPDHPRDSLIHPWRTLFPPYIQGGIVTVETRAGEVYRGVLDEAEDNMNLILKVGGMDTA